MQHDLHSSVSGVGTKKSALEPQAVAEVILGEIEDT